MGTKDIQRRLTRELNDAQAAYEAARERFLKRAADIPSGIAAPDGPLRMTLEGKESREMLKKYARATIRYSEFTSHGIIPEDIRFQKNWIDGQLSPCATARSLTQNWRSPSTPPRHEN